MTRIEKNELKHKVNNMFDLLVVILGFFLITCRIAVFYALPCLYLTSMTVVVLSILSLFIVYNESRKRFKEYRDSLYIKKYQNYTRLSSIAFINGDGVKANRLLSLIKDRIPPIKPSIPPIKPSIKNGDCIKIIYLPPCRNGMGERNPYIGMKGTVHDFNGKYFSIFTGNSWLTTIDIEKCKYIKL
jgi:hypothetical protein